MPKKTKVFLDVLIGTKVGGRLIFELFYDITPRTAENFRGLCTGEYGLSTEQRPLHFVGCKFFKIVPGFVIQSGDFDKNNGEGGESVYGPTFQDENFTRRHAHAGVLSMANSGRHTNASQFCITLKRAPQLDGRHVAFGQLVGGMEVVRAIEKVPVLGDGKPRVTVTIVASGELKGDALPPRIQSLEIMDEARVAEIAAAGAAQSAAAAASLAAVSEEEESDADKELGLLEDSDDEKPAAAGEASGAADASSSAVTNRLAEMRRQINQSRNMNNREVVEEKKRMVDPNYAARQHKRQRTEEGEEEEEEEAANQGKRKRNRMKGRWKEDKAYMGETASLAGSRDARQKEKLTTEAFGWSVFNQDSLLRAHEKRVGSASFDGAAYSRQKQELGGEFYEGRLALVSTTFTPTEEAKNRLVHSIEKSNQKRKNFSRRRMHVEDEDVSYISERNRHYNKKLERSFGEHSAEIKQNLERGTAL